MSSSNTIWELREVAVMNDERELERMWNRYGVLGYQICTPRVVYGDSRQSSRGGLEKFKGL